MVKLYVDSSNNKEIIIKLEIQGKMKIRKFVGDQRSSQMVLPLIAEIVKQNNLSIHDITAVYVNLGPGSFTGLRVGAAVANTLGLLLNIPINDMPIGQMAEPNY